MPGEVLFGYGGRNFVVRGSPYEQGEQQGRMAKEIIARNIGYMRDVLTRHGDKEGRYRELLSRNEAFLKREEPSVFEEMEGISRGSGLALSDIVTINLPFHFLLDRLPDECSMFYVGRGRTWDGNSYLMKTRDMSVPTDHIVLTREYSDGKKIVELNGAGIVTYPGSGLNGSGLALATTGMWSDYVEIDPADAGRAHIFINSHLVLEHCATVKEAVAYIESSPRMNGLNLILADGTEAVAVETTRDRVVVCPCDPEEGFLARSNHYISEELKHLSPTREDYPSTWCRWERMRDYGMRERLGFQDMLELASDHVNGPENCICRHGFGSPSKTVYAGTIVLETRQVWTTLMNPCEGIGVVTLR